MSASVELVPIGADSLSVLRSNGTGWLVLKQACEALGVDAEGQRQRLAKLPWATACVMQAVGADGRNREMFCLRTDRVAMWLATIETSRIADPAARRRLELWQCNAAEALDRWFRGEQAQPAQEPQVGPGVEARLSKLTDQHAALAGRHAWLSVRVEQLEKLIEGLSTAPAPVARQLAPTGSAPAAPDSLLDFSIKSLSFAIDIPKITIYSWIRSGRVRAGQIDGKWVIRLTAAEIEALRMRKGQRGVRW